MLVNINRHGSSHSYVERLRKLINNFFLEQCQSNLKDVPLGPKIIQLLRYHFPHYLHVAFDAFLDCGYEHWLELGVRRRNPIPSIYFAQFERYIKGAASVELRKLQVGNLPTNITEEQLRQVMPTDIYIFGSLNYLMRCSLSNYCLIRSPDFVQALVYSEEFQKGQLKLRCQCQNLLIGRKRDFLMP